MRIDIFLVEKNYFETRTKAQQALSEHCIFVNNQLVTKASFDVSETDTLLIKPSPSQRYVSIGGLKLEKAIQSFQLDFKGKSVLDIGASTGGFTDCSLQYGACKVSTIDVGSNQLHKSLLNHPKINSFEQLDIRDFKNEAKETFDWIVMDVSFIALHSIIPAVKKVCSPHTQLVVLIKPQFETSEKKHFKNGIIKDQKERLQIVQQAIKNWQIEGFEVLGQCTTDADGIEKNIEYLIHLKPHQI
jgi:23S rRNA (cytidine1920-2'-O)/16S rRNA (cytidine1409-2'-O)-methyltransferase